MDNIEDINKLLEKYLEPGENILYATRPDPELIEKQISYLNITKKIVSILVFLLILFIFYVNKSVVASIFQSIFFLIFFVFFNMIINAILPHISTFVNGNRYYYITDMRVITLEPNEQYGDKFFSLPIDDKLQVYIDYQHKDVLRFQQGYSYSHALTFYNIKDAKDIYKFMKGLLNK